MAEGSGEQLVLPSLYHDVGLPCSVPSLSTGSSNIAPNPGLGEDRFLPADMLCSSCKILTGLWGISSPYNDRFSALEGLDSALIDRVKGSMPGAEAPSRGLIRRKGSTAPLNPLFRNCNLRVC